VPYHLWQPADPQKTAVVHAALNNYKHELLLGNAKYIPIVQQHGSADDNVPAFHSRLMHERLEMLQWHSNYYELAGGGHWFDGIMTTPQLRHFYRTSAANMSTGQGNIEFTLTVANPVATGSKRGFKITRLRDPGQLGKLYVQISHDTGYAKIRTSNVISFDIRLPSLPTEIEVDDQEILHGLQVLKEQDGFEVFKTAHGQWTTKAVHSIDTSEAGLVHQVGALDSILKSNGAFTISYSSPKLLSTAVQISRNLYQYFSADSDIVDGTDGSRSHSSGNAISLCEGKSLTKSALAGFPIVTKGNGAISIRDKDGEERVYDKEGLAAIFLRPLEGAALELVVWGRKAEDVGLAARLVPMLTGVGQPAFIVLRKKTLWEGVDGVLAMGFFDHLWNVTGTSFFE
jgi:hypothetical protein